MKIAELFVELGVELDEASLKKAEAWLNKLKKKTDGFDKFNKRIGKSIGTVATGVAGFAAAAGAAFGIAVNDAMDFNKAITTLKISSGGAMGTADQMTDAFLRLSRATAISKEELVAGAQAYVAATGDGKGAIKATETFARVARASSTPMADVAKAGAAIQEQFGLTADQLEDAFSELIAGGKVGKIELTDMASLTSELAASFKILGDSKGIGGLRSFGAIFQTVAKDAGNAEGARTNLLNLLNKIGQSEFALQKAFGKKGSLRKGGKAGKGEFKDLVTILGILKQLQDKDPKKFQKAFGSDMQAGNALRALTSRLDVIEQIKKATEGARDVAQDLAEVDMSPSGKSERAWNDLKVTIAEAFTPDRLAAFAKVLANAVELASNLAGWIAELTGMSNKIETQDEDRFLDDALLKRGGRKDPEGALRQIETALANGDWRKRENVDLVNSDAGVTMDDAEEYLRKIVKRRRAQVNNKKRVDELRARSQAVTAPAGAAPAVQNNVTINANGVDPKGVVDIAKRELAKGTEAMLRDASAATPGGR